MNKSMYIQSNVSACMYMFFCVVVFSCSWSISSSIVGDLCRTGSNIKGIGQSWLSIRFKLGDKIITQRWKHWLRPLRTQRTACHCLEFRRKCQPSSNSGRQESKSLRWLSYVVHFISFLFGVFLFRSCDEDDSYEPTVWNNGTWCKSNTPLFPYRRVFV